MWRSRLAADGGMIFVYADARLHSYWMKNCLIPIDLIYLDGEGRVLRAYAMRVEAAKGDTETVDAYERRLHRYPSREPAQFVIELAGGTLRRLAIYRGERILRQPRQLATMAH